MKIALVYDRVNKWGGAERVLLALHRIFPHADLFTSVYDAKNASWAHVFPVVKPSFIQSVSCARNNHELLAPLMPMAFESFDFTSYDLVISVSSEAAKGVVVRPPTKHIDICLTPTRYLWSGYDEYFKNSVLRFMTKPLVWYLRTWDKAAAQRADTVIAISKTVSDRITAYYGRESHIIYPPLTKAKSINAELDRKLKDKNYFLFVSRLSKFVPYKKVELVLQTAHKLQLPLYVIGDGRDKEYYQTMAGPTVKFLGRLTDQDLFAYYKNAQALIFPAIEDFGLVMVEAQSMGTPIIAIRGGGAEEIVIEGKTGVFFDEQTVNSLSNALKNFDRAQYNTKHCQDNAQRFSFEQFEKKIRKIVSKY